MNTNDDAPAPTFAEEFAPDPRASRRVAAAQRARRALGPAPDAPAVVRQQPLVAIGAAAVILLMVAAASYHLGTGARPLQLPAPTAAPTQASKHAHEGPSAPFSATPAPTAAAQLAATPTAIPLAAPVVAPIRHDDPAPPQTGRGMPAHADVWTPPEPTAVSAPSVPTATIAWPTSAPATAADFAKPDIRQTCTFIGCVGGELAADLARANACHAIYWQYEGAEDMPEPDYSLMRACVWEGLYK